MQSDGSRIESGLLGTDENRIEFMLISELNLLWSSPLSSFGD